MSKTVISTESTGLLKKDIESGNQKKYPVPLSLFWRIFHFTNYANGGITFFIGSIVLFPSIYAPTSSAILYTVGSLTFYIADSVEWLTNNHVGCFWDQMYAKSYEEYAADKFEPIDSWKGKWQRMEIGLNFFTSSIGSLFYLIGSICFLPTAYYPTTGLESFAIASSFIIFAQVWKCYRAMLSPPKQGEIQTIDWKYIYIDLPGFLVDFFVIFGAAGYLIGSIIYLQPTVTSEMNIEAATVFTLGGLFYVLSATAMFYRYFFTLNYPHSD
jgi:hypothetical protein